MRTRSLVLRAALANAAVPAVAAITAPVIAQTLGPGGRGGLAAVLIPLTLADAVGSLGLPITATYFVARGMSPRRFARLAAPYLLASWIVTYAILGALATSVAGRHGLDVRFVLLAWSSTGAALVLNVLRAVRMAQEEWSRVNWERVVGPCLRLGVIVALVWLGLGTVQTVTWCYIGTGIAAGLLLVPRSRGAASAPVVAEVSAGEIRRYSTRSWATTLLAAMNARVDQLLLVFLISSTALGNYAVSVTIAELPVVVAAAVYRISLTRAAKGQSWSETYRQSRLTTAATLVLAGALAAVALPMVTLIFGGGFVDVRWLAPGLMLATVVSSPVGVLCAALNGTGRPAAAARPPLVALVIDTLLVVTLAPLLGALGAVLAVLASAVAALATVTLILRRQGERVTLRTLLVPSPDDLRGLLARRSAATGALAAPALQPVPPTAAPRP